DYYPDYFSMYSNTRFFNNWFYIFYWLPIAYISVLVLYAVKRKWLKFIMVLLGCFFYSQVVNISYPGFNTPDFYWENMYAALCVLLALPLMYDLFPILENRKWVIPTLFVLVALTAFQRVNMLRQDYRGRIDWYRGYLDKYGNE